MCVSQCVMNSDCYRRTRSEWRQITIFGGKRIRLRDRAGVKAAAVLDRAGAATQGPSLRS